MHGNSVVLLCHKYNTNLFIYLRKRTVQHKYNTPVFKDCFNCAYKTRDDRIIPSVVVMFYLYNVVLKIMIISNQNLQTLKNLFIYFKTKIRNYSLIILLETLHFLPLATKM